MFSTLIKRELNLRLLEPEHALSFLVLLLFRSFLFLLCNFFCFYFFVVAPAGTFCFQVVRSLFAS